jgi:peroxiredoxin
MHALCLSLLLAPHAAPAPPGPRVGGRIADFALRDFKGQTHRLGDWHDRKLVVVVFLGVDCPLAKLYAPRLVEMDSAYRRRGVAFVAVDPNRHDSLSDLARYAREHRIPFPLLKDVGNVVADRFDARRSPEAFVLDARRVVCYRGRIDDQYGVGGLTRPRPTRRDLALALDELLAGKPVRVPVTDASGCPLARVRRRTRGGAITYHRDVAPILQRRCQACHRPGQSAPFALTTFRQAAGWAGAIREVVEEPRMPPWSASPAHGKFANDPSLTQREKQTLFGWIDAGCPEGDPAHAPAPVKFRDGWAIPGPDLVVSIPQPFTVPAEGAIEYQYFVVDPGFREDRWVRAAEVRPSNSAVVHHCNVFLQPPETTDPTDIHPQGTLGSIALALTAPGTPPMVLPDGMAKRIPAGWRLVFVVHYTAVGSVQTDRTRLGLTFADPRTVRQEVATRLMFDPGLSIPPGARHHELSQTWQTKRDLLVLALFPHMHLRGKSFRYTVRYPDGGEEILLDVPRYDFNWQHRYVLAAPKRLPAGTQMTCTAVYDNSADNPANPDPSATVRAGPQSWDEMFNGYWDVAADDEDLTKEIGWVRIAREWAAGVFRPPVAVLALLFGGVFLSRRRIARWCKSE